MELTIEQALQQGVAAHKEGKLEEAERLYRAILQSKPLHPDANHNLGVVAVSVNKADLALPLFKAALEVNPKVEQFWLSYIDALIKDKQFDNAKQVLGQGKKEGLSGNKVDALESQLKHLTQSKLPKSTEKKKSLTLKEKRKKIAASKQQQKQAKSKRANRVGPSQAQVDILLKHYQSGRYGEAEKLALTITQQFPGHQFSWKVLGGIFKQAGKLTESLNAKKIAVQLDPQDYEAHYNLGNALEELNRPEEAEGSFKKAIVLQPDFATAHYNLGNALQELGRLQEAEASHRQAIKLKPDFAEAHYNLGNTLQELGRLEDAEVSYRQAIALKPDYANAHNNLGNTLKELGKLEEAEASFRRAITVKPDYAGAHNNLGAALQELGRLEEAEAHCRQSTFLKPDYADAHHNLGVLLFDRSQYSAAAEEFELSGSLQSKLKMIRCLYLQDDQVIFYKKLDFLINYGEINAVIGSLISCSEIKYGIKKSNPFCNDPLRYVIKTDLKEQYEFENIFIKTVRDVLADNSMSHKVQGHLTNGIQTSGNIFSLGKVSRTEIESIIRAEIEKYRNYFKDSEEGFIKNWPTSYNIFGWVVSMQSGGKLNSHMHDTGWLTGSVYINVPPKSKPNSGSLVLSLIDKEHAVRMEKKQDSIIDVVTGSLCLFPSSLHHYTVPFEEAENRIVLAFDVIPTE